jgi:ammonium transporter, Amt family
VAGTLGALLTGVFATRATHAVEGSDLLGLLEGGTLLRGQIIAALVGWGLAIGGTFVILKVLDAVMGLRVGRAAEIEGLDFSQHGEEGYIFI